jgi:TonB-dependent starch-binding outer membrane protein SusC
MNRMTKLYLPLSKKLAVLLLTLITTVAWSQTRTVTGKVTNADDGTALPGVNIIEKGTSNGTVTDSDGGFSLTVKDNATLVFSFVGMATQEIAVGSQTKVDVSMVADLTNLGEVVVVGYQTLRKQDLTGAISQIGANDFNKGVYVSPSELLQGKVAGVLVVGSSGAPGAETSINIRGVNSIRGGNGPLIVIDGIQLDNSMPKGGLNIPGGLGNTPGIDPLSFINPNDIESFSVMKDASATAIYGSRGANGVILITTKKAREGGQIDFAASTGVSTISKRVETMSAGQFRNALDTEGIAVGDFGGSVNAFDKILQTGTVQNYNIGFSTNSERSAHRFSVGYTDQKGIIKESGLKKINAMMKSNYKFFDDRVSVDFILMGANVKQASAPIGNNSSTDGNVISQAMQWNPTRPLYEDGTYLQPSTGGEVNPMALLGAYDDQFKMERIVASVAPTINIMKGLDYKVQLGYDQIRGERGLSVKKFLFISGVPNQGFAYFGTSKFTSQQISQTLTYSKEFGDVKLKTIVGHEFVRNTADLFNVSATGFSSDEIDFVENIQNALPAQTGMSYGAPPDTKLQSFFGQANVNIGAKYILTATLRADGSSKFGTNNRYGIFPSAAFAANLHEFDFVPTSFDLLKLRVGYGKTGNQGIPPGAASEMWGFATGGGTATIQQLNKPNPNLKWEATTTINVGVEFGLFNSRLTGSIEYFDKRAKDFIFQSFIAQPGPAGQFWENIDGEIRNKGVEVSVGGWLIENDNVKLELGTNLTFLQNKFVSGNDATIPTGTLNGKGLSNVTSQLIADGQPVNAFYLRDWTGIDANGFSTYRGFDEIAGVSPRYFVGDPNPNLILGIYSNLTYKKFDATINLNGAMGHQIYNNTANAVLIKGNLIGGSRNTSPDLIGNGEQVSNVSAASSRYLEDGDYIRLANLSVGYNFDFNSNAIKKLRLYVTGQNLAVFTNYSGFDPEVNTDKSFNGVPSNGIEYTPYPRARTFLVGVTASF